MADTHDLARELLKRARDDQRAARALLPVGEVSDAIVGFHAQQAVEKALKAALAAAGAEFPFTHNLTALMQLCEDAGLSLPGCVSEVDLLTPYAAQLRYGTTVVGTVSRGQALELAGNAVQWASEMVPAADDIGNGAEEDDT